MDTKRSYLLPLLFVLMFLSLQTKFLFAADTLNPGESLAGKQALSSKGDHFELGLFRQGESRNYYLGIWYKRISKRTVVWVANRETPLRNNLSEVKIGEDGNLLILNRRKVIIWSSNSTLTRANLAIAELLDTGNLVLRERSNSSQVFWQSFDYPTDTWLPGGWLGCNKIRGEKQLLTSWRSYNNPAVGPYTLELDPDGTDQYIMRRNRNRQYWSSGVWDSNGRFFTGIPEMQDPQPLHPLFVPKYYDFVTTDQGKYFSYSIHNTTAIIRLFMDVTGQLKMVAWLESSQQWFLFWAQPEAKCDVPSLCGSFGLCSEKGLASCSCVHGFKPRSSKDWNLSDWSGGCMRRTPLNCDNNNSSNREKDAFWLMTNVRAPDNLQVVSVQSTEECESACLKDCSCSAYSVTSGCSVWKGDLLNLRQLDDGNSKGVDIYVRLAAVEVKSLGNVNKKGPVMGRIMGLSIGCVVLMGVIVFLMHQRCGRKNVVGAMAKGSGSLIHFTYRDLQIITKNFSDRLGGGGFGSVYRGALPDSSIVAVKKLESPHQGEKQFRTEVSTVGTIQHMNLASLRGFCSQDKERLLVYEYMPNGSLATRLFDTNCNALNWETRYQIALGTARGLAYLHEECRDCIIHCDIKPENILLDAEFCPKVADFGLAKLMGRDFSRVLTSMRGTRGYLAPEWIWGVAITRKADVYSYGMMLLEIISGKRNIIVEQSADEKSMFFPAWAAEKMREGDLLSLADSRLDGETNLEQLERACRVAFWCIQDKEDDRPSMGEVVQILEGVRDVTMPPFPRYLWDLALD